MSQIPAQVQQVPWQPPPGTPPPQGPAQFSAQPQQFGPPPPQPPAVPAPAPGAPPQPQPTYIGPPPPPWPTGPAPQPPPEDVALREVLRQRGFPVDYYQDDEQLINHLASLEQQNARLQQLAVVGQQALQAQQQQAPGGQPVQPAERPKPYWDPQPDWEDAWSVMLDERGMIKPEYMTIAPADLPLKYRNHLQWAQKVSQKLIADPVEAIWPGLAPRLEQEINKRVETALDVRDQQEFLRAFAVDNRTLLFQHDQSGRELLDATGSKIPSPVGQVFLNLVVEEINQGKTDVRAAVTTAMQRLSFGLAQAGVQVPQSSPMQVGRQFPGAGNGTGATDFPPRPAGPFFQRQPSVPGNLPPWPGSGPAIQQAQYPPQYAPAYPAPSPHDAANERFYDQATIQAMQQAQRGASMATASAYPNLPQVVDLNPITMLTQAMQQAGQM